MAIIATHNSFKFGVGDMVKVHLKIHEGDKERTQIFDGMVISIKNRDVNQTFTVRKIGAANVGIERIFQLTSPFLQKVEVVKPGTQGVRRAKLYYIRNKNPKEIELIYSRAQNRINSKNASSKKSKTRKA